MPAYPTYHKVKSEIQEALFKSHGYINAETMMAIVDVVFSNITQANDAATNNILHRYEKGKHSMRKEIASIIDMGIKNKQSHIDILFKIKQHIDYKRLCRIEESQKKSEEY